MILTIEHTFYKLVLQLLMTYYSHYLSSFIDNPLMLNKTFTETNFNVWLSKVNLYQNIAIWAKLQVRLQSPLRGRLQSLNESIVYSWGCGLLCFLELLLKLGVSRGSQVGLAILAVFARGYLCFQGKFVRRILNLFVGYLVFIKFMG